MANILTSCCINNANNAWVTMSDGSVYAITDVTNPSAAWNLIPGSFLQISCATRNSNIIAAVNNLGELWWATVNITIQPKWTKCTTAPKLKYVSLNSDGTCNCITIDNKLIYSNGNITTSNPPFNIINATPGPTKVISTIPISYNGYSAIATDTSIYVTSYLLGSTKPDWTKVLDAQFLDVALSPNGNLYWVGPTGVLTCLTTWNIKTGSDIGAGFNHVNCNAVGVFIATKTNGTVVWGNTNKKTGENSNNLVNLNVSIPAFIASNSYASLTNSLSNPRVKDINTLNDGPASYIQRMAKSGITDFTPFKLLTLNDLENIGKAHKVTYTDPNQIGKGFNIWIMTFDSDDPYLPVGDVFINAEADINKVLCILVKNSSEYSTLVKTSDYKELGNSFDRYDRSSGYTYNTGIKQTNLPNNQYKIKSALTNTKSREYKNTGNYLIGDIISGGNQANGNESGDGNSYYRSIYNLAGNFILISGTSIQNVNTTGISSSRAGWLSKTLINGGNRPFVAVNPQYLTIRTEMDPKTATFIDSYKPGNNMKSYWKLFNTNPFNTFAISPGGDINSIPVGFQYVDFLPSYLVASICGNGKAKTDMGFTNSISPVAAVNCQAWMDTYMKMNNYENVKKTPVSDWCGQSGSQCDDNLSAFCTMGPNGQVYTKKDAAGFPSAQLPMSTTKQALLAAYPNSTLGMCGCFMPSDYSIAVDYNELIAGGMNAKDAAEFMNLSVAGKAYQIPGCFDSSCANNKVNRQAWKNAPGGCRATQICMNKAIITNAGTITGNVNVQQDNNCQSTTVNAAPATTNAAPVSTPATTNAAPTSTPATTKDNTIVNAKQNNINSGSFDNKGNVKGDVSIGQENKAEQTVIAAKVDPAIAIKAEEERKKKAAEEEAILAKQRAIDLKKLKEKADAETKKQLESQGPGVVVPTPKSNTMLYIIIAIIVMLLIGGGAFIFLK
jgi:hypothetical protein